MDAVEVEPGGEFVRKGIGRPLAAYNVLTAKVRTKAGGRRKSMSPFGPLRHSLQRK